MTEPLESADGNASPQPFYANAAEAWQALVGIDQHNLGLLKISPRFDSRQVAVAISKNVAALKPDWQKLQSISFNAHRHCTQGDAETIQRALNDFLGRHWDTLGEAARQYAINHLEPIYATGDLAFSEVLERWPALTQDTGLHSRMATKFTQGESFNPELQQLASVQGTVETARIALEHVWRLSSKDMLADNPPFAGYVAAILRDSAGQTRWGQLQALLWLKRMRDNKQALAAFESGLDQHVREVASLLQEFGLFWVGPSQYRLSSLSPESRESWRRGLQRAVGSDIALRDAVVEALFLYGSPQDDREVLFAAAALQGEDFASYVEKLRHHSDRFVGRRAAALLDLMASVPDVIEQELLKNAEREDERMRRSVRRAPTRTWIGDQRIEQLIEQTVNDVARSYSNDIGPTRSSGEETHVAILFDRISQALGQVSARLEELARQHEEYEYLRIQLKHRIVGKAEEGGPGTDGVKSLSTDVCILFTARDRDVLFAQRASLLQAKRITSDVKQSNDRYSIDQHQLQDLARQTMAGFLLTLGPCYADVVIPVIPARLMLDMIARGENSSVLYPPRAAALGKSIGTWLLEDVIGLWSGDWNSNVIDVAHGGVFRRPYMLVELVAERVRIKN